MATEILAVIDALNHPTKFYAGVVLWDDKVVEAADIVKYMRKWSRARVRDYCAAKGWKISVVHQMEVKGYG
jgi:hypothetical protein